MAIALQDSRIKDEFVDAVERVEELELEDRQATIREAAVGDAKDAIDTFAVLIEREDVQEVSLKQAKSAVTATRTAVNNSFAAIRSSLETELAIKRANGDAETGRTAREAETFLDRVQASEFKSMSHSDALSNLERVSGYLDDIVPGGLNERVTALATPALTDFRAAVKGETKAGGKWVEAQAALENGRKDIRESYLTFRDHVRGILRKTGQLDKLNQIVPTLQDAIRPGGSPTPNEPVDEDKPEPVVTPEPQPEPEAE